MKRAPTPKDPPKGKRPDFSGVQGEIVAPDVLFDLESHGLAFGVGQRKESPYDGQLKKLSELTDQLLAKGEGRPAMRFGDRRAKPSLYARSKKLGLRLEFAEHSGALYVRVLEKVPLPAENQHRTRRDKIIAALKVLGASTHFKLAAQLRTEGDQTVDASIVLAILRQMTRDGEVIQREGDTWGISPTALKRKVA